MDWEYNYAIKHNDNLKSFEELLHHSHSPYTNPPGLPCLKLKVLLIATQLPQGLCNDPIRL